MGCCTFPSHFFNNLIHGFMDQQLQHRFRCRDLQRRPNRPRSTADGGRRQRSAKGRDRRRRKAGVGACRASRARTRAEAPTQVRKGPFDPPLCVSPLVCPSDAMLLPSSATRDAMAPLRPAQVPCRLNDYSRNRFLPPTSARYYFWAQAHRSCSHFRALLSAAPSPETLIPPLSPPLPRLPSHVHSNTC